MIPGQGHQHGVPVQDEDRRRIDTRLECVQRRSDDRHLRRDRGGHPVDRNGVGPDRDNGVIDVVEHRPILKVRIGGLSVADIVEGIGIGIHAVTAGEEETESAAAEGDHRATRRDPARPDVRGGRRIIEAKDRSEIGKIDPV